MRAWLGCLLSVVAAPVGAEVIDVREGTNLSLAVHPDNEFIAVNLLGGLWSLPVTGGGATPLIPAGNGISQPRFDPAGERIVFQRWDDGQWDIWQLTLATGEQRRLSETGFDEREPEYAPDGSSVVFAANRTGNFSLWSLDLATGALRQLTDEPGTARFPAFDDDGTLAYVHIDANGSSIRVYEGGPRGRTLIDSNRRIDAPSWRPGGGVLIVNERIEGERSDLRLYIDADEPIWRRLTESEDVFVGRPGWLSPEEYVYAADGALWRRGIGGVGSVDRRRILMFAGVDIATVAESRLSAGSDQAGPFPVAGLTGLVRHSDSDRTAFSALADLWLIDDGELIRLTDDAWTDLAPRFSADGESLIFTSDRDGRIDQWRLSLITGELAPLADRNEPASLPDAVTGNPGTTVRIDDDRLRWRQAMAPEPFVIQAERLFDGISTGYRYHVDIHITGRRITDIVSRDRLPLPARVIDAREATVLPGLIDVHAHLDANAEPALGRRLLQSGVTTVRDVTSDLSAALERAETWASGQQPGPRVVIAPLSLPAAGTLAASSPIPIGAADRVFGGLSHALAAQRLRDGSNVSSGLNGIEATSIASWFELSTLGRSYGDMFGRIRASGAYLATGLGVMESTPTASQVASLANAFNRIMRDSGRAAIGSDAPAVAYGSGYHHELMLLARSGTPNDQILRLATAGGAIAVGLSLDLGTVEPGRLADLIIVDGDPLNDLGDLERIDTVIVNGVLHDADALGARQ